MSVNQESSEIASRSTLVNKYDLVSLGLSGLCLFHCLLPLALSSVVLSGAIALRESADLWVHLILFLLALPMSLLAVSANRNRQHLRLIVWLFVFGFGCLIGAFLFHESHTLVTILGVSLIALAHLANLYTHRCDQSLPNDVDSIQR